MTKTDIGKGGCAVSPTPSLNVSLTPELEQFIADMVASGRYQTASEVVRAGLRLLEKFEAADLPTALPGINGKPSGRLADGQRTAAARRRDV